jgi:two-component system, chemotaxis family, sensor kinase CheA
MHADGYGISMDDIVRDFLIESRENLDRLDQELVSLESDPTSKELLGSVFRTIHTVKGSCGFLGFARLQKVAHAGENLLSKLRDGVLPLDAEITSALLTMVDAVRHMLNEIQTSDSDGQNDYPELLEQLQRLQTRTPAAPGPEPEVATTVVPPPKLGAVLVERGCLSAQDLDLALQKQREGDCRRLGQILIAMRFCSQEEIDAAQQVLEARGRSSVETVRVSVDLLDTLMNLVGELVLARNELLQVSNGSEDPALQSASQRVNLIVSQMQEQVIKTRMQPISNVWTRFPRTIRDLARSCGKDVRLEMEGQDTELDRTIMEAIRDPLTHLVRNAIDHGIEMPEIRQKLGKEPGGRLQLRACQQGGKVTVEVIDDGAGLSLQALCSKAVERGLVTTQQAKRMSEREIFNLIFLPGFSTAKTVTNVSGRGVGMDVVKTNVERIGGAVDIESIAGQGTTVRIKIPLTLAIVPALIVRCRNQRFAIPQASVLELVGLDETGARPRIETVHGYPVYRLRGNLLPLLDLDRQLDVGAAAEGGCRTGSIVVLQASARRFGLVVDDILDTEEIVVKPLGEHLKGINAYCGSTIMGDGRVVLILDVVGLAERAHAIRESQESSRESYLAPMVPATSPPRQSLLLARNGPQAQVAIPLSAVARLERLPATLLRRTGQREVMEYGVHVIPVLRLSQALAGGEMAQPLAPANTLEAVIYTDQGHTVGVIVDGIIDIVDEQPTVETLASRPGVISSFVSDHNVVEMLDLPAIVRSAIPNFDNPIEQGAAVG